MRRKLLGAIAAALLTAATTSCAGETGTTTPPTTAASASVGKEADIYVQVLRRYLGTPAENSFPGETFKTAYVLDQAFSDAGDAGRKHERGTPIGPNVQRHITAALAREAHVAFIADRNTVLETKNGCVQVIDGGILITLGPADGDEQEVRVAVNGFVACLGATWLTYVVRNQPGSGWRVTGTTGSMAIS